jgi:hypothetical protein
MILRYEVNQAEAFRQGIDVQKSTNHLNVDPAELTQEVRNLIADRLDGIDVCELGEDGQKLSIPNPAANGYNEASDSTPRRIKAKLPTFEALVEAIRENEKLVKRRS